MLPCVKEVVLVRFLTKMTLLVGLLALVVEFAVQGPPAQAQTPGKATLVVTNEADWPLFIYVDEESFCYVDADKGSSCKGIISPGSHELQAVTGSEVIAQRKVSLEAGKTFTWTVRE